MAKMLLNLAVLVASAIVLSRSSVYLIDRLTRIAIKLRVSEYLVGFVIMAVATSLPELAVGITSAIDANPTLSLGNVLGSNILNLTLVLGLAALVAGGLRLETQVRNREVFYMDLIAISPLILLLDGHLSRIEGVILLILFAIYMYTLIFQSREYHKVYKNHKRDGSIWKELALLLLGTAVLVGSADVLVRSAQELALALNMPEIIIGIFLIALSTSLPEIATAIPAAIRRQGGLVMGNLIGSTVTNSTLILGVTALISPITIQAPEIFGASALTLVVTLFFFTIFVRSGYRISRVEAITLILGYIAYIVGIELFYTSGL